jgi:hypothetical protein
MSIKAGKGQIALDDSDDDSDDSLQWKWLAGEATAPSDFGNPSADTEYDLCVFDAAGQPVAGVHYRPDDDCDGASCWKTTKSGFSYNRRVHGESGSSTSKLVLRAGEDGRAKITASARGGLLQIGGIPPETPVVVQLQASNGECWSATFSAPAETSEDGVFEDRAD